MRGATRWRIRQHHADDVAWAIRRQTELYAQEHGYLPVFGTYVQESFASFTRDFDEDLDAFWVAESDGRRVGAAGIQHESPAAGAAAGQGPAGRWAKFRWYFVEPGARGQGIGRALLDTALAFARRAGYDGVLLWTVDDLADARRQYEGSGFVLAYTDPEPCRWAPWGHEQRWELRFPPQGKPLSH